MRFILEKRLRWEEPVVPREKPFVDSNDVKILRNDWPYGVEEGVVHLVVWTKFVLEADPVTDDLTDEARGEIEAYVREKFTRRVGEDNVREFEFPFESRLYSFYMFLYLLCFFMFFRLIYSGKERLIIILSPRLSGSRTGPP